MYLSVAQRLHFTEMLRRGRESSLLVLAAANASEHTRATRRPPAPWPDAGELPALQSVMRELEAERLVAITEAQTIMRRTPELFGMCEECGEAIPVSRLDRAPWSTRCDAHAREVSLPLC